jgi:hypothetical protein
MDELWCFNLFCLFRMTLFSYGCLIYCDKSAQENILTCSVPVTVKHQGGGQQQLALPPWPAPVRAASPVGCRNKLGQHRRSVRFDQNRGQRTTPPLPFHHTTGRSASSAEQSSADVSRLHGRAGPGLRSRKRPRPSAPVRRCRKPESCRKDTRAATDELIGSVDVWRRSGGRLLVRVRRQDVLSSLLKYFFYGGIVGATHQSTFFLSFL